jgi:hypothetical protein
MGNGLMSEKKQRSDVKAESKFRPDQDFPYTSVYR